MKKVMGIRVHDSGPAWHEHSLSKCVSSPLPFWNLPASVEPFFPPQMGGACTFMCAVMFSRPEVAAGGLVKVFHLELIAWGACGCER